MAYEWLIDGLEATWNEIDSVVAALEPERLLAPTPCPGWSVHDVVAHLVGFELLLAGAPLPELEGEVPDHVKNDIGKMNEAFVASRRAQTREELLAEFRSVSSDALARLRAMSDEAWEVVGWSPEGEAPYHRFMETRILDSWIHLQDIRDALAMPSDDHGIGEEIVVNRFEAAMAYVVGRRAKAPEGSRVRFSLIGRLARSFDIEVVDGRARAASTPGEPALEIVTPVALFWRRAAGRISAENFLGASATEVIGDRDLAVAIAIGMAVMI
jgi:uncharacterized protein (TIGR03083 family)